MDRARREDGCAGRGRGWWRHGGRGIRLSFGHNAICTFAPLDVDGVWAVEFGLVDAGVDLSFHGGCRWICGSWVRVWCRSLVDVCGGWGGGGMD